MQLLLNDEFDAECGRHSGIPECCIDFFVKHWSKVWMKHNSTFTRFYRKALTFRKFDHVACPHCLITKNVVKLKKCKCGG